MIRRILKSPSLRILITASIILPTSINTLNVQASQKPPCMRELSWSELNFPKNFMWGAATSAIQIEGTQTSGGRHSQNSWTMYPDLPQPGIATGHWDRYKEDVQLIKKAGFKIYRFSIAWDKVEPEIGVYDLEALAHYENLIDELIANGIEPMICLLHHCWPVWFEKMGGFEKSSNINYFVNFGVELHKRFGKKVKFWMTFNEPVGYCFEGFVRGKYPPRKKLKTMSWLSDFRRCGKAVFNMLKAHTEFYQAVKQVDKDAQIGFCHIFQPLKPYHSYNFFENTICKHINYLLHDAALEFFKSGKFRWLGMKKSDKRAATSLDWIGVNYYTSTTLCHEFPFKIKPKNKPGALVMGSNRELCPEGLRWAIRKTHKLLPNTPIYITENGVNDPDDQWKDEYMRQHLSVIAQEINYHKIDIRGYFWWTLLDSFSWNSGVDSKMGIYKVDPVTLDRSLRNGVENFLKLIQNN